MSVRRLFAVGSVVLLVLSACSDDDGGATSEPSATQTESPASSETEDPTPSEEPLESPEDSDTEGPSRETEVEAEDSPLGTILTDSEGQALYVFLNDAGGESACYDDCATTWPPLVGRGEVVAGDGVDASLLGTSGRTDGAAQVTYDGQPLYYFSGDAQPGDTNGQALGDVWYVVSPDGEPIQA